MNKLSVAIITKNEELNIERCVKSVAFADEIVVVDSGSTDNTIEICDKLGCKVYSSEWLGFAKTKQKVVDLCSNNWVLVLDADEEVTVDLKKGIEEVLNNPKHYGYRIKRQSFYLKRKIKHSGWDKDYTLRLFNKEKGRFNNKLVHESIVVDDNNIGLTNGILNHYTYKDIENHIEKMIRYSKLGSQEAFRKGKKASICKAVLRGIFKFIKMYILKLGFLDGKQGFVLALNSAFGVYLKYLYIWEMNEK